MLVQSSLNLLKEMSDDISVKFFKMCPVRPKQRTFLAQSSKLAKKMCATDSCAEFENGSGPLKTLRHWAGHMLYGHCETI